MPRPTLDSMPSVFTHGDANVTRLAEGYYQSKVNLDPLDAALNTERNGVRDRKYDPADLPAFAGKPRLATIIDNVVPAAVPGAPAPVALYTVVQVNAATAVRNHNDSTRRFQQDNMSAMQRKFTNTIRMIKDQRMPLNMEKQALDDAKLEHLAELDREQKRQIDYASSRWTPTYERDLVLAGYSADQARKTTPMPNGIYETQKKGIEDEFKRYKDAINESLKQLETSYKTANTQAFKDSAIEYVYNAFVVPGGPVAMGAIVGDDVAEHERRRQVVTEWIQKGMLNLKTGKESNSASDDQSLIVGDGEGKVNFNINNITKDNVEKSATAIYLAWRLQPENATKTSITLTLKSKPPHTTDEIAKIRLLGATLKANHGIDVKFGSEDYGFTREQKLDMKRLEVTKEAYNHRQHTQAITARATDIYTQLDAKAGKVESLTLNLEQDLQRLKDMDAAIPRPNDADFLAAFNAYNDTAQNLSLAMSEYSRLQTTLNNDPRYVIPAAPPTPRTLAELDKLVSEQEKHLLIANTCAADAGRYLLGGIPRAVPPATPGPREDGAMDILNRLHPVAGRPAAWIAVNNAVNNAVVSAQTAQNASADLHRRVVPRRDAVNAVLAAPQNRFRP